MIRHDDISATLVYLFLPLDGHPGAGKIKIEKGPEPDVRTYAFRLRSGCVVDLELPIDLSRKDVNRIKIFLDALLLDD